MESNRVTVAGWYGKGNIGDELFKPAFRHLWPDLAFDFIEFESIPIRRPSNLWLGGGSFLNDPIPGLDTCHPKAVVGAGLSDVHPANRPAIEAAKVRVSRSAHVNWGGVGDVLVGPDLVFGLPLELPTGPRCGTIVLLNDHVTPHAYVGDTLRPVPISVIAAWNWFVQEFAQLLVSLPKPIRFMPMCVNPTYDDRRAAAMVHALGPARADIIWDVRASEVGELIRAIGRAELVVTQRYHGAVIAMKTKTPVRVISHHDKLKGICQEVGFQPVPYYGFTKSAFIAPSTVCDEEVAAPYLSWAQTRWNELSGIVMARLSS